MLSNFKFHSALESPIKNCPGLDCFNGTNGYSFVHNLCNGIPTQMHNADLLYAELPWKHGYDQFSKRSKVENSLSHFDLLTKIGIEITNLKIPAVMVMGTHGSKHLKPNYTFPIKLSYANESKCLACIWGIPNLASTFLTTVHENQVIERPTSSRLIEVLAQRFNLIGDFACGYGNSGRIFVENGKKYIMSDSNNNCVGYISQQKWA